MNKAIKLEFIDAIIYALDSLMSWNITAKVRKNLEECKALIQAVRIYIILGK